MARIGLILYLMLAAAAGPWLCCCSAAQLGALAAPAPRKAVAEEKRDADPPCACCRHATPAPRDADCQVSSTGTSCHCAEGRPPAVASVTPVTPPDDRFVETFLSSLAATTPAIVSALSLTLGNAALPFHDTDDLLRAFHILRC